LQLPRVSGVPQVPTCILQEKTTPGNQVFHVGCLVLVFSCFTVSHYVIYMYSRPLQGALLVEEAGICQTFCTPVVETSETLMDFPVCRQRQFVSLFADLFDHLE
jgi:hypothetical protein